MKTYDPVTVMQSRRDSTQDRDLKKWLRSLSDEERFGFISACLDSRGRDAEGRALDLATSCISNPSDAKTLVARGLTNPDASTIKWWLEFGISKLGGEKLIGQIAALLYSNPSTVDKALYWLPMLLPADQPKAVSSHRALRDQAVQKGILKGPKESVQNDGSILFSDIYPKQNGQSPTMPSSESSETLDR
jgi:hypothetical protein